MITFHRILEIYGIKKSKLRLVRHSNKEIPIRDTFRDEPVRFEMYQSFQAPKRFGNAERIAVFGPHHRTTGIFLGLWDITGCLKNADFNDDIKELLKQHDLPESWFHDSDLYKLQKNLALDDLSERLVIEWGRSTVSWVQSKDKEVVEIKPKKSIGDFQSYSLVDLSMAELRNIIESPASNQTWVTALSSVNGVYLIRDKRSGKLYVGSAYGENGMYGRWSTYAQSGHGGNQELKPLDANHFQFSILEILSATTTADGAIQCENRWKEKLGTRTFGLNNN